MTYYDILNKKALSKKKKQWSDWKYKIYKLRIKIIIKDKQEI